MLRDLQCLALKQRFQARQAARTSRLDSLTTLLGGADVDPQRIEPLTRRRERARLLADSGAIASIPTVADPKVEGQRILEAVVASDDRLPRQFFTDGARTAAAVCRIATLSDNGETTMGTGFAIAPGIVMTNNHVLPTPAAAARGAVEFGYWSDFPINNGNRLALSLHPDGIFFTDMRLDVTIVSFDPAAADQAFRIFGRIELLPKSGKALIGEPVNIIQHAEGGPQTLGIRDNLVIDVFDDWIHYSTDTEAGASGAPVLNDQWQLAALHHASIEHRTDGGRIVIVNEGTRISSIMALLAAQTG